MVSIIKVMIFINTCNSVSSIHITNSIGTSINVTGFDYCISISISDTTGDDSFVNGSNWMWFYYYMSKFILMNSINRRSIFFSSNDVVITINNSSGRSNPTINCSSCSLFMRIIIIKFIFNFSTLIINISISSNRCI